MKKTGVYCDRCGKEFKYAQTEWAGLLRGLKPQKIKLTKLFYGNPSGHDYSDRFYELCKDCTKALQTFIEGGAE